MARLKKKWVPPKIDGAMEMGAVYRAYNSKHVTKDQAKKDFRRRYGSDPTEVFNGKPNGSIVYAGPVPGSFGHG